MDNQFLQVFCSLIYYTYIPSTSPGSPHKVSLVCTLYQDLGLFLSAAPLGTMIECGSGWGVFDVLGIYSAGAHRVLWTSCTGWNGRRGGSCSTALFTQDKQLKDTVIKGVFFFPKIYTVCTFYWYIIVFGAGTHFNPLGVWKWFSSKE